MNLATPEWLHSWIDTPDQLDAICDKLAGADVLSIDTETSGWKSGNERLSLVQVGLPDEKTVYLIDPLRLEDLSALSRFLSGKPLLIAHNIQFEERQFARYGISLSNKIDTMILARELWPDLPSHSLKSCCKLILGKELSKEQQISDWSVRPLSEDQLCYARLDAEIVYELYSVFQEIKAKADFDRGLEVSGLMQLLCTAVNQRIELLAKLSPELAVLHARERMLREVLRERLIQGEAPYEGEFGSCKISRARKIHLNPLKVKQQFPEFASLVIQEQVDAQRLKVLMKENGIPESKLDEVSDITGHTDRLIVHIK